MTNLEQLLDDALAGGEVPGAAALVARNDHVEVASVGDVGPDSIVRIASITKPITAAAVMLLVEDGRAALDDPIARWLPELESPVVVRTPATRRAGKFLPGAATAYGPAGRPKRQLMMAEPPLESSVRLATVVGPGRGAIPPAKPHAGCPQAEGPRFPVRRRTTKGRTA